MFFFPKVKFDVSEISKKIYKTRWKLVEKEHPISTKIVPSSNRTKIVFEIEFFEKDLF